MCARRNVYTSLDEQELILVRFRAVVRAGLMHANMLGIRDCAKIDFYSRSLHETELICVQNANAVLTRAKKANIHFGAAEP